MSVSERGHRHNQVLRIQADEDLPEHKVAVSLDDLDRAILEMHQKDVFFSYAELAEKWGVSIAGDWAWEGRATTCLM